MYRSTIAALIALTLAPVAAAENYANPEKGFKLTVPDGWSKDPPQSSSGGLDLVLRSPRHETTRGTCPLDAAQIAETQSKSQEQINEELTPVINEAFWRAAVGGGLPELAFDEIGSELRNGRRVFTATARFTSDIKGTKAWVRMKATMQAGPGHIGKAACMTWLEESAPDDADIGVILGTFESTRAMLIAGAPARAPATLVLFAGPRFAGAHRELTQDIPNLFQAGWSVPTASFVLKGHGLWEICDGANYTGNCRLLAGAASGEQMLRIGSARRVNVPGDARATLGVMADGFGALVSQGLAELAQRRR